MTHAFFYRFGHSLPEEQATVHADLSVAKTNHCHIDQTRFPEHLLGFHGPQQSLLDFLQTIQSLARLVAHNK